MFGEDVAVPDTIEAEVLEIDGSAPPPQLSGPGVPDPRWRSLRGRVLRLDRRWWPLGVLLGLVAVVIAMFCGLFLVVFLLVAKLFGWILRLLGGGPHSRSGSQLSRPGS